MASRDSARPNIVFILSDDQGAWAMGCAGNDEMVTPNLDRLAATGLRFDNFFCASPVCSPARASILTGRIPSRHGVQDFLARGNSTFLPNDGENTDYIAGQPTYVELLAAAGYECGLSGKWHLGYAGLQRAGFSYWNVHAAGGGDYYRAPMIADGEFYQPEGYVTDVITDNALEFLGGRLGSDAPFSLNVHYTAPHAPWGRQHHPDAVFDDFHANCAFDTTPIEPVHPQQLSKVPQAATVGSTPELRRDALSGYFAAVTEMDRNIGRLLDWLEANGLRESTLVVFMADNGMNMGHHGIWGKGNGTYPPNMYDTSVKIPALMSMPTRVPQGLVCDRLLSQYDAMPTLLSVAGVDNPYAAELPGRDFSPVLRGEPLGDAPVFVYDEYGPTRMIRGRNWKYVHRYPDGPNELYNLAADPMETANVVGDPAHSGRAEAMRGELQRWFDRYSDEVMDGSKQNVTGRGQLGLIASDEHPKPFADDVAYFHDQQRAG